MCCPQGCWAPSIFQMISSQLCISPQSSASSKQRELVSHLSAQIWFSDGQAGPVSLDTHTWLLLRYSDLAVSTGTSL